MGIYKCHVGCIWSLVLAVIVTLIPRYWELRFESLTVSNQPLNTLPRIEVVEGTIAKNTTLVATLADYNVPVTIANEVVDLIKPVFDLRNLRFGNLFRLEKQRDGTLHAFEYKIDDERILRVEKAADSYAARVEKLEFDVREATVTTEIRSSLWEALAQQPKGEWLTLELANNIFAWDVDFSADVQRGDKIRLIVDEWYHDGKFVKYGKIQAAELVNEGRTYRAFLFRDAYYDEKGNTIKRPFLASPLEFTRVSSRFTRRRMHPILNTVRPHLAVDYAAPSGTPVLAVANGTVTLAGWSGGYGRLVQIRHANGLATGYAHLSRITPGIRPGRQIKQGERIGAVGASGLANGPHLHYMMTRSGRPINPATIKSQPPVPLEARLKPEFFNQIASWQVTLESLTAAVSK